MSDAYSIMLYFGCGVVFSAMFEYVMYKSGYKEPADNKSWERIFWITTWPYLLVKFFFGYFKK
tara:strand:+ start:1758 stop:1946 length:189 start_codon:yes stop_codon:yes gene_type:complete